MREIKFRSLIENKETGKRHWEYYGTLSDPSWFDMPCGIYKVIVKDSQYTGLNTRDADELYEGDVVATISTDREGNHAETRYEVKIGAYESYRYADGDSWTEKVYGVRCEFVVFLRAGKVENHKWHDMNMESPEEIALLTKIGNIYENPELIRGRSEKEC